jgi:hypothetical protein
MLDNNDIVKLSEVFATKEDLKNFATKDDVLEFKNEILTGQDEILKELKALSQEKTVKDAQDERQKKVLEIHNHALVKSKILSEGEVSEINKLRVF